jgi:hypothetical protein
LEWTLLYAFFVRRTGAGLFDDLWAIARFAICAAVMTLFLALAFHSFGTGGRLHYAIIAIAGAIAGLLVYIAMAHALGIHELRDAAERVRGRLSRNRPAPELRTVE